MRTYIHDWGDHRTIYINDPGGFCKVNVYYEDDRVVGELYDLIVYPEVRGIGIGNLLLDNAIQAAKQSGCNWLVLWPDTEVWVTEWYARKGFEPNEPFRNYDDVPGWAKKL